MSDLPNNQTRTLAHGDSTARWSTDTGEHLACMVVVVWWGERECVFGEGGDIDTGIQWHSATQNWPLAFNSYPVVLAISLVGHAWNSPNPRGQLRTEKCGGNWLWLWCPNDPCGSEIGEGEGDKLPRWEPPPFSLWRRLPHAGQGAYPISYGVGRLEWHKKNLRLTLAWQEDCNQVDNPFSCEVR